MSVSVRSTLSAGVAAGLVAVAGVAAVSPAIERSLKVSSPAVELSAAIAPLLQPAAGAPASTGPTANLGTGTTQAGDWIINVYNFVEPWVAYGVSLAEWATAWLPWPIGLIAPQIDLLYNAWQPIGQGLAYAASFLLDGQLDLVIPTLVNGVKTGIQNLVRGEINWVLSFFPPLPPVQFPVRPSAATLATRAAAATPRSAASSRVTATPRAALREQRRETRAAARAARSAARAETSAPKIRKAERVVAKKAAAAGSSRAARGTR